jgi:hypothetical protein
MECADLRRSARLVGIIVLSQDLVADLDRLDVDGSAWDFLEHLFLRRF